MAESESHYQQMLRSKLQDHHWGNPTGNWLNVCMSTNHSRIQLRSLPTMNPDLNTCLFSSHRPFFHGLIVLDSLHFSLAFILKRIMSHSFQSLSVGELKAWMVVVLWFEHNLNLLPFIVEVDAFLIYIWASKCGILQQLGCLGCAPVPAIRLTRTRKQV